MIGISVRMTFYLFVSKRIEYYFRGHSPPDFLIFFLAKPVYNLFFVVWLIRIEGEA